VRPEDIAWSPEALGKASGPESVRVRWLGTAGFAIESGDCVLLIDPYLTRASLARCVLQRLTPDVATIDAHVPKADAIIVGHTHFDHALDAPTIAKRTGARVFGSRSAAALCLAEGVRAERVEEIDPARGVAEREVGPFRLRFVPSAHSRFLLGRVPFEGDIADCSDVPMRAEGYRCGAVFGVEIRVAGRTLYHMGSAELVDSQVGVRNVDLLLMCVAGWTSSRRLPERVAAGFSPRAILLSHWDDFLRPIGAPARPLPAMQLARLVERLARAANGAKVGTVPILGDVFL
jgi:L-ascorbate metabolism protein UlaG (beta-lactamase superfamily)